MELKIILVIILDEKVVIAISVLPHMLETRAKKTKYELVTIIEVRLCLHMMGMYI